MNNLVLSLFPGIDLLGLAFQEVMPESCIVRGPDVIFGSLHDIRTFHPATAAFWGIIGGPPCQSFSSLVHLIRANGHEPHFGNLIPEFERCVLEAQPEWFLMENVPGAPVPTVPGYYPTQELMLNNRWVGAEQNRLRRFCFSIHTLLPWRPLDVSPDLVAMEVPIAFESVISGNGFGNGADYYKRVGQAVLGSDRNVPVKIGGSGKVKSTYMRQSNTVTSNVGGKRTARKEYAGYRKSTAAVTSSDGGSSVKMVRYSIAEALRLQGLPEDFLDDAPFTKEGKLKAIANGVPLPMGKAIARAVRRAMEAP